jgi:hypothetical protein
MRGGEWRGGEWRVASGGVASGGVGIGGYRQKTHRLFMFFNVVMKNHACQVDRWSVIASAARTPVRCPKSPDHRRVDAGLIVR